MSNKKLVFSGVQPTGNLHLGNYLGALKNFVSLQKEMECLYCVVDLHAITVFQDPKHLYDNVLETTASFLATGLDPNKSIIFNQSSVSGHAELAWILNCVSRIGWLNRKKILLLKNQLMVNLTKILISTIVMLFILIFSLNRFVNYLDYSYNYKAVYLISIVTFVGMFYLLSCYLLGILKFKNYKTN